MEEHVANAFADLRSSAMTGQSPLELNPYAYTADNPLRWTDPTGQGVADVIEWCASNSEACAGASGLGERHRIGQVGHAPGGAGDGVDVRDRGEVQADGVWGYSGASRAL